MERKSVAEFDVPFYGNVQVYHTPEDNLHGEYWARNTKLGVIARYSTSVEDAIANVSKRIASYAASEHIKVTKHIDGLSKILQENAQSGSWIEQHRINAEEVKTSEDTQ